MIQLKIARAALKPEYRWPMLKWFMENGEIRNIMTEGATAQRRIGPKVLRVKGLKKFFYKLRLPVLSVYNR
jgi:hypothetical protein